MSRFFSFDYVLVLLSLLVFWGIWKVAIYLGSYPAFILPSPEIVFKRFITYASQGDLWLHIRVTTVEVLFGFLIGSVSGMILGYLTSKVYLLERLTMPYIVASQSIPIIALAPLLILWFGTGYLSKIFVSALIVFFPILINTAAGFRSIDPHLLKLMHSFNAKGWKIFTKAEIPSVLPYLFSGVRIALPLAVVGAIVGEFLGASEGLGFLLNLAAGLLDTPLLFVALFSLALLSLLLYGVALILERVVIPWKTSID